MGLLWKKISRLNELVDNLRATFRKYCSLAYIIDDVIRTPELTSIPPGRKAAGGRQNCPVSCCGDRLNIPIGSDTPEWWLLR
jgi:hypothetical protein